MQRVIAAKTVKIKTLQKLWYCTVLYYYHPLIKTNYNGILCIYEVLITFFYAVI